MATADYINKIVQGDNVEIMRSMDGDSIDLTVTSPPYDNLRTYNGYSFDVKSVAQELYRITKPGGVVVWVVADATVGGSETGTSFRQALSFMEVGFLLHDTMIWDKENCRFPSPIRYHNSFEYMFVFSKGAPKTVKLIHDRKNKWAGTKVHGTDRMPDGSTKQKTGHNQRVVKEYGARWNVWRMPNVGRKGNKHPASFPEGIARDHILTWSKEGEVVLDPFGGSGTTAKMAIINERNFIHIDVSEEYCEIAKQRIVSAS